MEHSLAPRTNILYQAHWHKCQDFIRNVLQQNPSLPLTFQQIKLYVAHLHSNGYRQSTVQNHLSAISHFHKMEHLPDPTSGYPATKLLTGVRNLQTVRPDTRLPITRNMLLGLLTALNSCATTDFDIKLYRSMFTNMYYACLRASEVMQSTTPQHNLTLAHIDTRSNASAFHIKFTSYKHSSQQNPVIAVNSTDTGDCPVKALHEYLSLRGTAPGPLYLNNNRPVTRQQFNKVFQACLNYLNLPIQSYNIHSFRIGRTTDMAEQEVPPSTIQRIGRWNSTAYMKYIRPQQISTIP
jgi:site-specific recombinase XerD